MTAEGTSGLVGPGLRDALHRRAARQRHGRRQRRRRDRPHGLAKRGHEHPPRRHHRRRRQPLLVLRRLPLRPRHDRRRPRRCCRQTVPGLPLDRQHARHPRHRHGGRASRAAYASTSCGGSPVATGTPGQLARRGRAQPAGPAQRDDGELHARPRPTRPATSPTARTRSATPSAARRRPSRRSSPTERSGQASTRRASRSPRTTWCRARSRATARTSSSTARWSHSSSASSCSTGGAEQCAADSNDHRHRSTARRSRAPADTTDLGIGPCAMWTTVLPPEHRHLPRRSAGRTPPATCSRSRRITIAGDESEPNDTAATADPFPAGNDIAIEGTFGNTDAYTFTLDAPASVRDRGDEPDRRRAELRGRHAGRPRCRCRTPAGSIVFATDSSGGINSCAIVDGIGAAPTDAGAREPAPPGRTRSCRPAPPARATASC